MSPSRAVNLVPGTIAAGRAVRIGRPVRPRINRSVDYRYDVAFDERLALRVRAVLGEGPDVDERLMFGGIAFMVGDHMACGIVNDELMVRLGAEEAEKALRQPHVRPMDFTGRPMRTTVFVEPPGTRDEADLRRWVDAGAAYARSLPPKTPGKRRSRRPRRPPP